MHENADPKMRESQQMYEWTFDRFRTVHDSSARSARFSELTNQELGFTYYAYNAIYKAHVPFSVVFTLFHYLGFRPSKI